jgi:hypothetical protein
MQQQVQMYLSEEQEERFKDLLIVSKSEELMLLE